MQYSLPFPRSIFFFALWRFSRSIMKDSLIFSLFPTLDYLTFLLKTSFKRRPIISFEFFEKSWKSAAQNLKRLVPTKEYEIEKEKTVVVARFWSRKEKFSFFSMLEQPAASRAIWCRIDCIARSASSIDITRFFCCRQLSTRVCYVFFFLFFFYKQDREMDFFHLYLVPIECLINLSLSTGLSLLWLTSQFTRCGNLTSRM